jgi:uncharacterized Zn finger protein
MARKRNKTDSFEGLTWNDLTSWAGSKIVSRGKSYQRSGYVKDLARTPDGSLVAWVEGTKRYATQVFFEDDELESICSCPYWDTCKHAVAVVVEYLENLKKKVKIPKATKTDRRLKLLKEFFDDEVSFEEDDDLNEFDEVYKQTNAITETKFLEPFLKKHTKAQLVELIKELAGQYPLVMAHLQDQNNLSRGDVSDMVGSIRNEIHELSSEPGWQNHWRNEGYIPDYSRVKHRLGGLLDQGYADEVIVLGEELLEAGIRQVEMIDDEGETEEEIASCMDVVFRALPESSLSPADQMLWAVDREMEDQWALCEGVEVFWKQKKKKTDWNILADKLTNRLKRFSKKKDDHYRRDRLTDWIIIALKNAGRKDEIIQLCEKEAVRTDSYVRLVRILMEANQWETAEQWIQKGIHATDKKWSGIAGQLRESLREIREKQGDWLQVAALRADDFFINPSLETFQELKVSAKKSNAWDKVKPAVMNYLETGKIPLPGSSWPLPEVDVPKAKERRPKQFPIIGTLIDIAIAEKRPDEVIHWYDQRKSQKVHGWWSEFQEDKIAKALADDYPDRAVDIWKRLAANLIAQVKPKTYEKAAVHLRKIRRTLKRQSKDKIWEIYFANIRKEHARKIKLLEILDGLNDKRILDTLLPANSE